MHSEEKLAYQKRAHIFALGSSRKLPGASFPCGKKNLTARTQSNRRVRRERLCKPEHRLRFSGSGRDAMMMLIIEAEPYGARLTTLQYSSVAQWQSIRLLTEGL
jgi:hypothetical protein